jgi:hypothetical protein
MKHLNRDSRSLSRDVNPRPPDYEAGMLTIRPLPSIYTEARNEIEDTLSCDCQLPFIIVRGLQIM